MLRTKITAIRFRPPIAIARLGDSDSPLEAFDWVEDARLFGAGQTIIQPAASLEVLPDGSVEPYMPGPIRLRDGLAIRPVCPFLELEADVIEGGADNKKPQTLPLTVELLTQAGLGLSQLQFHVIAANRKAQRRTGDACCGFEARLYLYADDHARHDLIAWTHADGANPLVERERPIWLGAFQSIRPTRRTCKYGVRLDTIRVRFTPGRGAVYGPPRAIEGQTTDSRRRHQIVPKENRILNPAASWCSYNSNRAMYPITVPPDTYDGEDDVDLDSKTGSWGILDDSCDAVVTATLTPKLTATARVLAGPPDYAPDRRPILSLADDLADRDPGSLRDGASPEFAEKPEEWLEAVVDLFRRIHETSSLINVERTRASNLANNEGVSNPEGFPKIDQESMTSEDTIGKTPQNRLMSLRFDALAGGDVGSSYDDSPLLPISELARSRHSEMAVPEVMLEFIRRRPDRFVSLLRPPFRRMSDPKPEQGDPKPGDFREASFARSYAFDARMPPFMRDSDFAPLSLTRQQWNLLFETKPDGTYSLRSELFEMAYRELRKKQ